MTKSRHEEIKYKEEKRAFLERKNPERYQQIKKGPKQNRSMVLGRWKQDKKKQKDWIDQK